MKNETKHTPVPWQAIGQIQGSADYELRLVPTADWSFEKRPSVRVKGDNAAANAQFIVKAVNSHADLLAALKSILNSGELDGRAPQRMIDQARTAIARAEQSKQPTSDDMRRIQASLSAAYPARAERESVQDPSESHGPTCAQRIHSAAECDCFKAGQSAE